MTVRTTSSVIVKTRDGQTVVLDEKEKVITETYASVVCDGPKCALRHGLDAPLTFSFQVEKVKDDPDALPEIADTFIPIIIPERSPSFDGQNHSACSVQCFKDWLTFSYIAAPSRASQRPAAVPETNMPVEFQASVDKNEELLGELANGTGDHFRLLSVDEINEVLEENGQIRLGSPSAEDLDAVARETELATATVSDPTGYSGDECCSAGPERNIPIEEYLAVLAENE